MRSRVAWGTGTLAFGGEEGVVRVVGGVEEVLMVELAEDEDHEDVAGGHGVLRMGLEDGLEAGDGAVVVEDVEVLEAFVDDGVEVEGVGVEAGVRLLGVAGGREEDDGGEDRYGCGMKTGRPACDARPGLCCCGDANPHSAPCDWTDGLTLMEAVNVNYTFGLRKFCRAR